MCLVKDPAKRPNTERLLRHAFFRHAKNTAYLYQHLIAPLPPLAEREKALKVRQGSAQAGTDEHCQSGRQAGRTLCRQAGCWANMWADAQVGELAAIRVGGAGRQ